MIVAPERDVPGISANACASPTFSASRQVIVVDALDARDAARWPLDPQDHERADDERDRDRHRLEQRAP